MTKVFVTRAVQPGCLHCVLHYAIGSWAKQYAPKAEGGTPILDVSEVVGKLAEVIGDIVHEAKGEQLEQFQKYARECLEATFTFHATGELVAVGPVARPRSH